MRSISSGVEPRRATAVATARRRRSTRICVASASACAAATCASVASRSRTLRIVGRSIPRSRSVRTRSSRAAASVSYRR
ncbi:hypothetical protein [Microbispora sp. GKU 823]|uniref:hypothetical protein n=1 Tax=Microbispora sp. GKU 823 TaxID=1652100 RepID=UPI002117C336|nr:hypothetical protein [Microbispora sp. GKU 823]